MLKVLIAEDEPLSLQNLSGQMRDLLGADALIEGVANGREAVERARQIQPQLVLMDIEMPVMNGLDAAAIIHKAMPETHIVFLTAFDRFDYAVGAMRAGGTDYLVKPFDSAQITACLRKLNLLPESRPAVRGDKPGNTFCTQFSVWLEHHYMQDVSLDQAAEAMGMSSFYFSRFFRCTASDCTAPSSVCRSVCTAACGAAAAVRVHLGQAPVPGAGRRSRSAGNGLAQGQGALPV